MKRKMIALALSMFLVGTGLVQSADAGSPAEDDLETFTVGGIDVTGLPGLEVSDPLNDQGAVIEIADFTDFAGVVAELEPGVEIKNPYEDVKWDRFHQYKANLHTHTTYSDGIKPPHERIDEYHEHGYSILSLTDHDTVNPDGPVLFPWTDISNINEEWEDRDPEKMGMVAVPGVEITGGIHFGSHFNDFPGEGSSDEEYVLQQIQERGGLAQFFHPGMHTYNNPDNLVGWYADKYKKFDCLVGMEVYNGRDLFPRDRQFWDNVLMKTLPDKVVWAFGNDDNHYSAPHIDFLLSWNVFLLEDFGLEEVKEAYAGGGFFACNKNSPNAPDPPTITSIVLENDLLEIRAQGYDSITWIADGEVVGEDESIDLSSIKYDHKYVRAKLVNADRLYRGRILIQPFQFSPSEPDASRTVHLNGRKIVEEELAELDISQDDELVVTVTAADGTPVRYYKVTTLEKEEPTVLMGDVNLDGEIDVLDVALLMRYTLELETLEEEQKKAADVNGDGKINVQDVSRLLQYVLDLVDSFD